MLLLDVPVRTKRSVLDWLHGVRVVEKEVAVRVGDEERGGNAFFLVSCQDKIKLIKAFMSWLVEPSAEYAS